MHKIVIEGLERHLAGQTSPDVRAHLDACSECRAESEELARVSGALRILRSGETPDFAPRAGFYSRVAAEIAEQHRSSFWGTLSGAVFFRRIAFASLLTLAAVGTFLATSQEEFSVNDAAVVIARSVENEGQQPVSPESRREQIMMALADWSE